MVLERELETYKKNLSTLLEDVGKFVLIKGETIAGTFNTYEDAIKEGYREFGLEPFLVKKISSDEQVQFITRLLKSKSCHT